ncbi:hypothetical protein FALBO_7601 [Fusarium albosuccineum]|uniref:Uncharacterized protein n=1 Tax=Fusarium albosuccineum TaxID=1237068 RepID=A0A8H4L9I4_9HYPO|nr:hypothetical protein FALBO_7601 [Fusarium albosuccineum]
MDGLTVQHNTGVSPQINDETAPQGSDPEGHEVDQDGPGKGVLDLAGLKESDPTQFIVRRFIALTSLSMDLEANYLEKEGSVLRRMVLAGDDGVEEFNEKFMTRLGRYRTHWYQFGCQVSEILGFDEPKSVLLNNVLPQARDSWSEGQGLHLNAPDQDWASIYNVDKFEQTFNVFLHRPLAQRIVNAISSNIEESGGYSLYYVPMGYIRFAIVGAFNCFVGVFVAAPVAIQALNVTSPAGEVATYVAFVIVAGFLIQTLVTGFTRQLLVYLAYAGVMAAVMRQRG